jgi:hypothetical protein
MGEEIKNGNREYNVEMKKCIFKGCQGELEEISYYERNNWVTVEYQCKKCKREIHSEDRDIKKWAVEDSNL